MAEGSLDQERTAWAVALLTALKLPVSINGLVAVVAAAGQIMRLGGC